MSAKVTIEEIQFEEIFPIWHNQLWPDRQSLIEPFSIIDHRGELSLNPSEVPPTYFWGAFINDVGHDPVGVLSGFSTSKRHFRTRGLWVDPLWRRRGIATELVLRAERQAVLLERTILWTMPRLSSRPFYLHFGFVEENLVTQYEYGPHYIMSKKATTLWSQHHDCRS